MTLLLNIQRKRRDTTAADHLIRAFADRFWKTDWPGASRPPVYFDPRALEPYVPGGVLHAKAVVADDEAIFVTRRISPRPAKSHADIRRMPSHHQQTPARRQTPSTTDPKTQGPKPEFPQKKIDAPGSDAELTPRADHGEDSYQGLGRLTDRVALITGGDSGIGRAVALAYAREGADVAISYLPEEEQDAQDTRRGSRTRVAGR